MVSLPERLLVYAVRGGEVVPGWLDGRDHPWLRELLEIYESFIGQRLADLRERLRGPLAAASPDAKRRLAIHVLDRLHRSVRPATDVEPRRLREALFVAAARATGTRGQVVAEVAAAVGVPVDGVEATLFADLPLERRLGEPTEPLTPVGVEARANLALAQGLLRSARSVHVEIRGNARAVVRHAKLRGLICTVPRAPAGSSEPAGLEVSGPLALFRHTLVYGRALGELLPLLAWCDRYRLRARCVLAGAEVGLTLGSGDPIAPAAEPTRYDSKLERRFARDLRKAAPEWDLHREPEPIPAGGKLIFPDFALVHRHDPGRRFLLEIAGFWTPDYIARKLADLRAAALENLILCIDADRNGDVEDLPAGTPVILFRRRVPVDEVLRILNREPGCLRAASDP